MPVYQLLPTLSAEAHSCFKAASILGRLGSLIRVQEGRVLGPAAASGSFPVLGYCPFAFVLSSPQSKRVHARSRSVVSLLCGWGCSEGSFKEDAPEAAKMRWTLLSEPSHSPTPSPPTRCILTDVPAWSPGADCSYLAQLGGCRKEVIKVLLIIRSTDSTGFSTNQEHQRLMWVAQGG